jgi:hypothetical protein
MLARSSETTQVTGDEPRTTGRSGGVVGRGEGGIGSLIGGGV